MEFQDSCRNSRKLKTLKSLDDCQNLQTVKTTADNCRLPKLQIVGDHLRRKHSEIAIGCLVYISSVVSCQLSEIVLLIRIWAFEFCHNLSSWVLSQSELLILSQFEFLKLVKLLVECCPNSSFTVLLQLKFLTFVKI